MSVPYEKIENGFRVTDGDRIEFEKASVFTPPSLRDTISERYEDKKNHPILQVCQTCDKLCKQVKVKGVKFKCYKKEYEIYKARVRSKK